jgi:hypothetical protein
MMQCALAIIKIMKTIVGTLACGGRGPWRAMAEFQQNGMFCAFIFLWGHARAAIQ